MVGNIVNKRQTTLIKFCLSYDCFELDFFLLCFSMNYRDFTDNVTVSNNENMHFEFSLFAGLLFYTLFYVFSDKGLPKKFKYSVLV